MKKIIIAIICAIAATLPSMAQFRWGPSVGIDFTNLKFKQDLFTIDQSTGFSAGAQGELMFPGLGFGIDFAAFYTQRGATLHMGERYLWESEGLGKERSYLHYLEIPLNLRFKWTRMAGLEDYIAPYVFGGPTFSFLLAHNGIKGIDPQTEQRRSALKYATGDLGLQCGLGFEILHHWQIQASYTWGMTYALKTTKLDDFSARNRTWMVRVAYLF